MAAAPDPRKPWQTLPPQGASNSPWLPLAPWGKPG